MTPTTVYTRELGYGFDFGSSVQSIDRGGSAALQSDFCTALKPFFFSVKLPEGNYRVKVILGDKQGESITTIRAESRRLMVEKM